MALFVRLLRGNRVWQKGFVCLCLPWLIVIVRCRYTRIWVSCQTLVLLHNFWLWSVKSSLPSGTWWPRFDCTYLMRFCHTKTRYWVRLINERWWIELILIPKVPAGKEALVQALEANVLKAITILTARINGIGLQCRFNKGISQIRLTTKILSLRWIAKSLNLSVNTSSACSQGWTSDAPAWGG